MDKKINITHYIPIAALLLLPALAGCQYASLYNKVTDPQWAHADTSPDSVCEAMGAMRGNSSLDWCVAQEEADRNGEPFRFRELQEMTSTTLF